MCVGMFFAALAFVAAALVQINIDVRNHLVNFSTFETNQCEASSLLCTISLIHWVPFLLQSTLPKFPVGNEMQVKLINMMDKHINGSVGVHPFLLGPYTVGSLRDDETLEQS